VKISRGHGGERGLNHAGAEGAAAADPLDTGVAKANRVGHLAGSNAELMKQSAACTAS
jgi:hypothetical protein